MSAADDTVDELLAVLKQRAAENGWSGLAGLAVALIFTAEIAYAVGYQDATAARRIGTAIETLVLQASANGDKTDGAIAAFSERPRA